MKRMIEKGNLIKQRELDAYNIVAHGTSKAQTRLSISVVNVVVKELEEEDLSDGEMERMLERSKLKEIKRALNHKQESAFEEITELQQYGAMIEKKNKTQSIKSMKPMSQSTAVKLASSVPFFTTIDQLLNAHHRKETSKHYAYTISWCITQTVRETFSYDCILFESVHC
jgi:hypothetical protein